MEPQDEQDLIERCRGGDRRAFPDLVDRYKVLVFTLVDRMIGDKAPVEDLAQEVFIRVYQGLPGFRGEVRLSTWIYRIAYNVCVAELERARHRVEFVSIGPKADEERPRLDLQDDRQDPEAILSRIDVRSTIQKLLDRLPPRSKAILSLYYLQELSYEEIGTVMALPLGTVKTHLHRAKQALRDMIVEEGLWNEMSAGYQGRQATP
jgi:RNA polymerase sigma-70 factor (ECF subfamily)